MKILSQLSGGFDSVAACLKLLNEGHEVKGVYFDFRQPYAEQEDIASTYVDDFLKAKYESWLGCDYVTLSMELSRPSKESPKPYIPVRNFILAAHSANIAIAQGFKAIAVGSKTVEVRKDDPYSFSDCSIEFFEKVTDVVNFCSEKDDGVEFLMPLIDIPNRKPMTKGDCVQLIIDAGMDLTRLWSCYDFTGKACGVCYHCEELKKAFEEIGYDYSDYFLD
jgi:7-cyano-7-deazaguanine synthase